jgi:hypothetical protein
VKESHARYGNGDDGLPRVFTVKIILGEFAAATCDSISILLPQ